MKSGSQNILSKLNREIFFLNNYADLNEFNHLIADFLLEISNSDIVTIYMLDGSNKFSLKYHLGNYKVTESFDQNNEFILFFKELSDTIVLLEKKYSYFSEILLNKEMQSAISIPIIKKNKIIGIAILNSLDKNFYNREKIIALESIIQQASTKL